jgi:hypothetical protein
MCLSLPWFGRLILRRQDGTRLGPGFLRLPSGRAPGRWHELGPSPGPAGGMMWPSDPPESGDFGRRRVEGLSTPDGPHRIPRPRPARRRGHFPAPRCPSSGVPPGCRALRMARSGCQWLERTVLRRCHSAHGSIHDGAFCARRIVPSRLIASRQQPEGLCGTCDVMATPGRCQLVLLGTQLLWQRLVLFLVWSIGPAVRLEWKVALAACYLCQAHRRTDVDIAWSGCTRGCRKHDSSAGRWLHRI